MGFDPDKFDLVITILKFLAVFSSGLLAGEALCISRIFLPSILVDDEVSLRNFLCFWPKGLHLYQPTLVGSFAAGIVFLLETRERFSWLYGAVSLVTIFLYTKFYMFSNVTNVLIDLDISNKDRKQAHDMLCRFHQYNHVRTFVATMSFIWITYALYTS